MTALLYTGSAASAQEEEEEEEEGRNGTRVHRADTFQTGRVLNPSEKPTIINLWSKNDREFSMMPLSK